MRITTKRGDAGATRLATGERVSKGELRVETAGCIDELRAALGVARACVDDADLKRELRTAQVELFSIADAVMTPDPAAAPDAGAAMLARLDAAIEAAEAVPGIVMDWTVPGDLLASAQLDVARTACRRAERTAVRLAAAGTAVPRSGLAYLNRLSDALWLWARGCDARAGVDGRLRDAGDAGAAWSKAWPPFI